MATKATSTRKKSVSTTAARKAPSVKTATTVTTASAASTKNTFIGYVQQSVRSVTLWRALAAEFIGTFLFAAVIIVSQGSPVVVLFLLAGIVLLVGAISGAHVNPAITIGAWVTRRIGWLRAVSYVAVQFLGAVTALGVLSFFVDGANIVTPEAQSFGQSAPVLFAAQQIATLGDKVVYLFLAELLGTAILAFAVANATRELQDRTAAAFTVGFGIFIALFVAASAAGYVGGTAIINPAVAVALQAYDWNALWSFGIYLFAPVIGGILGFLGYDLLRGRNTIISQ